MCACLHAFVYVCVCVCACVYMCIPVCVCVCVCERERHNGEIVMQNVVLIAGPQVYVVICGGCVYCYSNEVSKKPASAFSLYGYDR